MKKRPSPPNRDRSSQSRRPAPHRTSVPSRPSLPIGKSARQVALAALLEHSLPPLAPSPEGGDMEMDGGARSTDEFINDRLSRLLSQAELPPIERRFATELTYGVVRRQATLDTLVQIAVSRPRDKVQAELWTLLRLGAYQLALCDGVPSHAAVDETVELARWIGRPEWVSFANGVLRSIGRLLVSTPVREPAANSLPTTQGRYRRLNQPVFADPEQRPQNYVSQAFSLPSWLVERWGSRFDFVELCRLGFWFNTPPSLCLRVNRLRTDREAVMAAFATAGVATRLGELPTSIWLSDSSPLPAGERDRGSLKTPEDKTFDGHKPIASARVDRLPGFADGWFVVQDESAQRASELLAPQPGETVLDLCAAPGTKTTHLAELMHNTGRIVAADTRDERLQLVEDNCRRLGISIVETKVVSFEGTDIPLGPFDAILIDAPCSNTGVLGKRPEARWRIEPDDIEELSRLQIRLLLAASDRVRPGGRIVYSTCSIEPEENTAVIEAVCHFRPSLKVVETRELIPGRSADGGFQCLVVCATSSESAVATARDRV